MYRLIFISALLLFSNISVSQTDDNLENNREEFGDYRNVIRWNLTPFFILSTKSIVLGYERVLTDWQSFSVNAGYLQAPLFKSVSSLEVVNQPSSGGVDISVDYRFYFKNRNRNIAPDGLYWGPYFTYYGIWQNLSLNLIDDNQVIRNTAKYDGNFSSYNLGIQLGYQFVIMNHFVIDLILVGPSVSYYDIALDLSYEQTIDINDPFYSDLLDLISENSPPFVSNFIKNGSFNSDGRLKFRSYGFRYALQIGYRF